MEKLLNRISAGIGRFTRGFRTPEALAPAKVAPTLREDFTEAEAVLICKALYTVADQMRGNPLLNNIASKPVTSSLLASGPSVSQRAFLNAATHEGQLFMVRLPKVNMIETARYPALREIMQMANERNLTLELSTTQLTSGDGQTGWKPAIEEAGAARIHLRLTPLAVKAGTPTPAAL